MPWSTVQTGSMPASLSWTYFANRPSTLSNVNAKWSTPIACHPWRAPKAALSSLQSLRPTSSASAVFCQGCSHVGVEQGRIGRVEIASLVEPTVDESESG